MPTDDRNGERCTRFVVWLGLALKGMGSQIIATANQHGEKRLSTPAYKFFGGKGYKEGQVAVVAFQKVVDDIYQQVGALLLATSLFQASVFT